MTTRCAITQANPLDRAEHLDEISRASDVEARRKILLDARSVGVRRRVKRYASALGADLKDPLNVRELIEAAAEVDVSLHGVLRYENGVPQEEVLPDYSSKLASWVGNNILGGRWRHNAVLEGVNRLAERSQASFEGSLREVMMDEGLWKLMRRAGDGDVRGAVRELFAIRRAIAEGKDIPEWARRFTGLQYSMGLDVGLDVPLVLDSQRIAEMGVDGFFANFHKGDTVRMPPRLAADGKWEDGDLVRWTDLNELEQAEFKRGFFNHWLGKESGMAVRIANAGANAAEKRRFGIHVANEREWFEKMELGGVRDESLGAAIGRGLISQANYLAREKSLHDSFGAGSRIRDGYRVAESGDNLDPVLDLVRKTMGDDLAGMPDWSLGKQLYVQLRELQDPGAVFISREDLAMAEAVIAETDDEFLKRRGVERLADLKKRQARAELSSGVSGAFIMAKLSGRILNIPIEFSKSRALALTKDDGKWVGKIPIVGEIVQQGRAIVGGSMKTFGVWFQDAASWEKFGVKRDDMFREVWELAHGEVSRFQADLIAYGDDIAAWSGLHKLSRFYGVATGGDSMNAVILSQRKRAQLVEAKSLAIGGGTKKDLLADADPQVRVWAHETIGSLRSEAWDAFVAARGELGQMTDPGLRAEVNGALSVAAQRDALHPTRMQRYGDLGAEFRGSQKGVMLRFAKAFTTSISAGTGTGFRRHNLKVEMGLIKPDQGEIFNMRYVSTAAALFFWASVGVYSRFYRDGKGDVSEWDDQQWARAVQRALSYSSIGGIGADIVAGVGYQVGSPLLGSFTELRPSSAILEARLPGLEILGDAAQTMVGGAMYYERNGIDPGDAAKGFGALLLRNFAPVNFPLIKGGLRKWYVSPYELEAQETFASRVAR